MNYIFDFKRNNLFFFDILYLIKIDIIRGINELEKISKSISEETQQIIHDNAL